MCTKESSDAISEVLDTFMENDRMFTALDVSRAVQETLKKRGVAVERHSEMKREIHAQMMPFVDTGIYEKTTVNVDTAVNPFLYYPAGADPKLWFKSTLISAKVPPQTNSGIKNATQDNAKTKNATQDAKTKKDTQSKSRLSTHIANANEPVTKTIKTKSKLGIPNLLVREIGLSRKSSAAYVFRMNGNVYVRKDSQRPNGGDVVTTYRVDAFDSVRITRSVLNDAGLTGPSFTMKIVDDEIEIS